MFDALYRAAPGYAIHEMEATQEMIQRFPHVQVVPLYDIVEPDPTATSPYGPGTRLRTIRNDLTLLREEFPTLLLSPAVTQ